MELYHSDLWVRLQRVLNSSSSGCSKESPSQATTDGLLMMGSGGGGGCAARRPEGTEGHGDEDGNAMPSLFNDGLGEDIGGGGWGKE